MQGACNAQNAEKSVAGEIFADLAIDRLPHHI